MSLQAYSGEPELKLFNVDKILTNLYRVLFLASWSLLIFGFGMNMGERVETATVVHGVKKAFDESIRTGKAFVFQESGIRLVTKDDRHLKTAYRVHTFIWPEDIELLPTPINKFGQYGKEWHKVQ